MANKTVNGRHYEYDYHLLDEAVNHGLFISKQKCVSLTAIAVTHEDPVYFEVSLVCNADQVNSGVESNIIGKYATHEEAVLAYNAVRAALALVVGKEAVTSKDNGN